MDELLVALKSKLPECTPAGLTNIVGALPALSSGVRLSEVVAAAQARLDDDNAAAAAEAAAAGAVGGEGGAYAADGQAYAVEGAEGVYGEDGGSTSSAESWVEEPQPASV